MDDQPNLFDAPPPDDDSALTLARYAERAYLDYAVSVVKGRALSPTARSPSSAASCSR
jgi:topoisomerase-4 subunit A